MQNLTAGFIKSSLTCFSFFKEKVDGKEMYLGGGGGGMTQLPSIIQQSIAGVGGSTQLPSIIQKSLEKYSLDPLSKLSKLLKFSSCSSLCKISVTIEIT